MTFRSAYHVGLCSHSPYSPMYILPYPPNYIHGVSTCMCMCACTWNIGDTDSCACIICSRTTSSSYVCACVQMSLQWEQLSFIWMHVHCTTRGPYYVIKHICGAVCGIFVACGLHRYSSSPVAVLRSSSFSVDCPSSSSAIQSKSIRIATHIFKGNSVR